MSIKIKLRDKRQGVGDTSDRLATAQNLRVTLCPGMRWQWPPKSDRFLSALTHVALKSYAK